MIEPFRKTALRRILSAILLLALAACANVHFEQGGAKLGDGALVFGKILLVRDGEPAVINPSATAITIGRIGANAEPLMITEPFERDGRFYWTLPPGKYMLNITLHQPGDDVVSLAFEVPATSGAYYFGDLTLSGKKHFHTLGGANIKDVSLGFEDNFAAEKAALLKRNPGLTANIGKLEVHDAGDDKSRAAVLRKELDGAPLSCGTMAEFRFEPLAFGAETVAEIGRGQGAFAFPEGRSYFAAFALPAFVSPYAIALRSLAAPSGVPGRFRVFVPAALLLDERFGVVATLSSGLLHPVAAALFPPRPVSMAGEIDITAETSRARYLVLYTTGRLLEASRTTLLPGMIGVPGGALPTGMPRLAGIVPWLTGRIEIALPAR